MGGLRVFMTHTGHVPALWLIWVLIEVDVDGTTSVSRELGSLGASWVRAARTQNWP